MGNGPVSAVMRHIRRLVGVAALRKHSVEQMLERFLEDHDDIAFAAILERHGPLVWRVSQRILWSRPYNIPL